MMELAPSILSADFARLADEIGKIEKAGADVVHLDVMDGCFVPNFTFGPPVVAAVRQITTLPLDAHLMVETPGRFLDDFLKAGVNRLSVHVEADPHIDRTLNVIKNAGVLAGAVINPATPLGVLEEILPLADFVLVMTVNPGFGGQKFIPSTLKKIKRLRETIVSNGYQTRIEVDGGVCADNLREVLEAGAEIIVVGSAVFNSPKGVAAAIKELKEIAANCGVNRTLEVA
jgi:ribulose-phosphate 3-epimerase